MPITEGKTRQVPKPPRPPGLRSRGPTREQAVSMAFTVGTVVGVIIGIVFMFVVTSIAAIQ